MTGHAVLMLVALVLFSAAAASIIEYKELCIDFTDPVEASAGATWSEPDILSITAGGLGWDGEPASLRDGWIHTVPMALGLSWRPPSAISIRVRIEPGTEEITLNSGQTMTPYQGDVYVRYSPDGANWSTWQVLRQDESTDGCDAQDSERLYSGTVQVPRTGQEEYWMLLRKYAELDVPWRSDEDAAVRWILENDADFFERQIPFIGYVEFLWEGSFHGGQRISSFRAEVTYGMSGLHYAPDDDSVYADRDSRSWSFRAEN